MTPAETVPGLRREQMKESSGGSEFKCDISDILQELLQILQFTPTQYNNNKNK
jgi:hypothetical protein